MKNLILFLCLLLLGCSSGKQANLGYKRKVWKQYFKDYVLCDCVLTGMGDKEVTQKFYTLDKSFYNEIGLIMDEDIKIIIKPVIEKMKRDSAESMTRVSEGAAGKRVFDNCLQFYRSRTLDSIAAAKYREWKRLNIDSIRSIKIPSY